jgi:hypothetical protein
VFDSEDLKNITSGLGPCIQPLLLGQQSLYGATGDALVNCVLSKVRDGFKTEVPAFLGRVWQEGQSRYKYMHDTWSLAASS